LKGKFIVGSLNGDLLAYKISEDGRSLLEEIILQTSHYPSTEVIGTAVSPNGDIYFGAYDIFRLDKIDPTSKEQMMIPIQIKATNVNVSNVNYSEQTKELTINLTNRHDSSSLTIKIPRSDIEGITGLYECKSKNNLSQSYQTIVESGYHLDLHRLENYTILKVRHMADAPETLQFTINTVTNSCVMN
jgi:hypothetical protein